MDVTELLSRLEKVRANGPDKWTACCPSHPDKSPSLAIKAMPDGRILLHCFAGCGALDVVCALGIELADLMPERPEHHKPTRRAFTESDAFRCLAAEGAVIAVAASDIADGRQISPADAERVARAVGRVANALEATYGNR